jgi:hypothetical protein
VNLWLHFQRHLAATFPALVVISLPGPCFDARTTQSVAISEVGIYIVRLHKVCSELYVANDERDSESRNRTPNVELNREPSVDAYICGRVTVEENMFLN